MDPKAFRCNRAEFVQALVAEGMFETSAGYITVPLYGEPVFQQHGFFGGHWPVKEFGQTTMDYSKQHLPEVEAILKSAPDYVPALMVKAAIAEQKADLAAAEQSSRWRTWT